MKRSRSRLNTRIAIPRPPVASVERWISAARNHAFDTHQERRRDSRGDDVWLPTPSQCQRRPLNEHPRSISSLATPGSWADRLDGQPATALARTCPARTVWLGALLEEKRAVFIMSVFRRRVYEGSEDSTRRSLDERRLRLLDPRGAGQGADSGATIEPLWLLSPCETTACRQASTDAARHHSRAHKSRPAVSSHPAELARWTRRLARFETERLAAEARASIEAGDFRCRRRSPQALHRRRGGAALRVAGIDGSVGPRPVVDRLQHPPDAAWCGSHAKGLSLHEILDRYRDLQSRGDLRQTLQSLARLRPDGPWEVIVVDNNSPDDTRPVVEEAAQSFPVELRYVSSRTGPQSGAQHRHPSGPGRDHRHDRR